MVCFPIKNKININDYDQSSQAYSLLLSISFVCEISIVNDMISLIISPNAHDS